MRSGPSTLSPSHARGTIRTPLSWISTNGYHMGANRIKGKTACPSFPAQPEARVGSAVWSEHAAYMPPLRGLRIRKGQSRTLSGMAKSAVSDHTRGYAPALGETEGRSGSPARSKTKHFVPPVGSARGAQNRDRLRVLSATGLRLTAQANAFRARPV